MSESVNGRRLESHHISSPRALGSGELKKQTKSSLIWDYFVGTLVPKDLIASHKRTS